MSEGRKRRHVSRKDEWKKKISKQKNARGGIPRILEASI